MNSCIYNGYVSHTRFKPVKHSLKYNTFSLFIDLDEIENLSKNNFIFSFNRFNIFSFFNKDHGDRDGLCLKNWVLDKLKKFDINKDINNIKLLCYPRVFGYVFNPLSIFFVYDDQEQLISILYEVKNTFGEQHTYVFRVDDKNNLIKNNCSKKFHVSPFIEMDCQYFFKILKPGDKLSVIIDQYDKDGKILFASQDGVRNDLNSSQLIKSYLKHPLMTLKIISAIHFEAFKLWLKGIRLVKKKFNIKNNLTVEN